jgi:outer membrane protein insertion porin family
MIILPFRRLLPAFLVILVFASWSRSQTDTSTTAKLFEDAAIAREEAAKIWDGLGERIRAAEAWGEAAGAWEKAARSWESAGDPAKAGSAWERFRAAITKRDQAEIRVIAVSGAPQRVRVARVSEPLVVRVTDKSGRPVAGIRVLFEIAVRPSPSDGSRLEAIAERTDSSGHASARLRLGTLTGVFSITASVPDLSREPAIFEVAALPGPAARLEIHSGNNQVLRVNQRALTPLVARVTDLYGNPVEGVPVSYRIVSAPTDAVGQSVSAEEATTDASGLCGIRFQGGHLGGSYIILVESGELEGSPSKFEMIVRQTIPTMRVSDVKIEGVTDAAALMAGSKLKIGETYLLPDLGRVVRDELRRLYATGRFEDVSASVDETGVEGEGVVLLKVVERSRVASVTITGMRRVKEADLRAVLGIGEGSPFSTSSAERSRRALLDHLENEGYLRASVTLETAVAVAAPKEGEATTARPPIAITYRVVEQDKVKISRMNLIGNKYYSDWSLNWHMKTGSGRVYKEAEFNEDRQKIIQRYVERGFLSAVMDEPVITYDRNGRMVLDVVIKEGPQYKMGEITFAGNTAVSTDQLRTMLKPTTGQTFRARKFFESIEKMRLATTRHGFAEARVIPQERLDQRAGIVDFVLRFEEGQILYLEGIEVEGNNKTAERIITREIRLLPGDVLDGEEIEKARKRLEALQFFEQGSVRMDLKQGSKPDQRVLSIKLAEGKTGQLQFGAGYSSVDKLVGFASITKRNFDPFDFWSFTGAGQEISFSAEYGGAKNSFSLSWTEPYWLNRPISIGFDLFNTYQEREGFDWRRRGGGLRLSHKYGEYGRFSYKYNVEQVELLRVTSLAPTDVQTEVGFPGVTRRVRTTASLSTAYNHDTRDDVFFPTSGHIFEISNQLAGRFFGGNVSFNRPVINWSQFRRGLTQTHVIAFRAQYGTITNFFERDNPIPSSEKFYLGGANSIRGYRERSVQLYHANGTLVGPGRSFALGNLEYRIPFTDDKTMSMAFFYDVGAVYDGEYEFGFNNIVQGVGAGVRFNTPLGPIRLDYGYGLDFPNKNKGQLHFSIGQAF